jgi:hypothetical protein
MTSREELCKYRIWHYNSGESRLTRPFSIESNLSPIRAVTETWPRRSERRGPASPLARPGNPSLVDCSRSASGVAWAESPGQGTAGATSLARGQPDGFSGLADQLERAGPGRDDGSADRGLTSRVCRAYNFQDLSAVR